MKAWSRATLLLTLAVVLAVVLRQHGGNVLIIAPPWRVELSLTLAVVLIVVLFFLLYGLLRAVQWLAQGPQRVRHWRDQRAQRKDRASLEQGWIGVLEGRSHEAEQQLSRLLARTRAPETKVLAALALARAQHEDGRLHERDETLAQAHTAAAGQTRLREAVAVVHAELLLTQQNQGHAALHLLQTFLGATPKALNATKLLLQARWQLAQYAKVFELARLLQRKGALKPEQARPYLEKAASERLTALMDADADAFKTSFKALWNEFKREEKLWPAVALQAAKLHARQGDMREAGKILEAALTPKAPTPLDAKLLDAWSRCPPELVAQRVAKAEDWLKTAPEHVDLLITLGKLCLQGQLWGAAERYLQRGLKLPVSAQQNVRIHALLGRLHDSLGHLEQALHHWRLAAGADAQLTPGQRVNVLPAADVRDDPGSMDMVGNDKPSRTAQAGALTAPLAASAADHVQESMPDGPGETFRDKPFADKTPFADSLGPATIDDLYFDSAVIPGVDLSQTSDQSGAHRVDDYTAPEADHQHPAAAHT